VVLHTLYFRSGRGPGFVKDSVVEDASRPRQRAGQVRIQRLATNLKEMKMSACDICNKKMEWKDGYILTTSQVTTKEAYWEQMLKDAYPYMHKMDPTGDNYAMLVRQMAGQASRWLVCESCSRFFDFDHDKAKLYAREQNADPPGAGAAKYDLAAQAAANVWKKLYGSRPSSAAFKSAAASSEKSDSSCFVATVVYGDPQCEALRVLRQFRDEILTKSAAGRLFVSVYYATGPMLAKRIESLPAVKALLIKLLDRLVISCRNVVRNR